MATPNEGTADNVVNTYKWIAGDGDLDERCKQIVAYWRATGFFDVQSKS
jgi:hypothetical protein